MTQEAIQISETPPLPGLKLVQDTNKAFQTIATDFAGPTDPAGLDGCGPYCKWADTANGLLKRRNAANSAWEVEGELFVRSANRNGDGTQNFDVASLNGGQLAGFRNKILNGRFTINQIGAASRTATANAYNFDQWYYDGTYLYQPIPTEDIEDGTYTLSWEGGSAAAWSLNSASSASQGGQSYTAVANGEQIVVSGHTNEHLWVRFQSSLSSLDKVQLEPGSAATPFEYRSHSQEQDLCEYFFSAGTAGGVSYTSSGTAVQRFFATFRKQVRSTPSVSLTQIAGTASGAAVAGTPYLTGFSIGFSSTGQGQDIVISFRASARI